MSASVWNSRVLAALTTLLVVASLPASGRADGGAQDGTSAGPVDLDEIVVRVAPPAPGVPESGPGASATVVDAEQFAGESKSVAEMAATSPGVAVHDYGGLGQLSTASIRGSSSDGVVVLLDGLPLNSAFGGGVNLSTIPRQWISAIEVVRGAQGARYGAGALGGALNVVSRPIRKGEWSAEATTGSFATTSASASGAMGGARWGTLVSLAWDQTDGDFTYLFDDRPTLAGNPLQERVRTNNAARSGGALAKAFVDSGVGRFDLLAQLSGGTHELPGSPYQPTPDDEQDDLRAATAIRHSVPLGRLRLSSELTLRHDRLDATLQSLGGTTRQRDSAIAGQTTLSWRESWHAGDVGVRVGGERLDATGLGVRRERAQLAAFASEQVLLVDGRVRAGPAVRAERAGDFQGVSADLGASWTAARWLGVRGSVGTTFRAPSFAELYLQQGLLEPNPDLKSETGVTADAAIQVEGAAGLARAGVFASLYRDLIVYEPGSLGRLKPFNSGKAAVRGLELEGASRPWGPLGLAASASYTLLASENLRGDEATLGNELPHRPRHRLYSRVSARRGPGALYVEAHYVGAQWRDSRNLTRLPDALTFTGGASLRVLSRPVLRLVLNVRNVLDERTLQDGFGNPLPGRMILVGLRAGSTELGALE